MFELTGKVAIITGAAAGLGQAIAVAYAKQGAKVVPAVFRVIITLMEVPHA